MANLFDSLRDAAHNAVVNAMGYAATWTPSDGSAAVTGQMLFRDPTAREDIGTEPFEEKNAQGEYLESEFPGLYEAVSAQNAEPVSINGVAYNAYKAKRKYDGQTIIIQLEPA